MDTEGLSKGEQTRREIIAAAHTLFVKQGYHGTSMREIAKTAGLALGGIYNHFATKEDIFRAVFVEYHPINYIFPALAQAHGESTEALLRDIARHIIAGLKEDPDFINLLSIDIVEFQGSNASSVLRTRLPALEGVYRQIVSASSNDLRPIPPLIFLRSFFGLFISYFMTGYILNLAPELPDEINQNAFDYFIEIFLHGVLSDTGTHRGGKNL